MHPAYSVIFFTTTAGAGYGLLALLGIASALGILPPDFWLGLVGLGLALGLVSAGLLSSTGHLGRPERAWRALSQWRSSWLSREGVASLVTYVPALLFAGGWVLLGRNRGWVAGAGLLAAAGAVVTVWCTAMIYASLKPVAEWHNRLTPAAYLIFSAMTGATLLNAIASPLGVVSRVPLLTAIGATLLGWTFKEIIWRRNGELSMPATANSATGLQGGHVRSVEWPHTERNYLLKEMGFRIARKHAVRLRAFARATAFALPLALLALAAGATDAIAESLSVIAVSLQLAGILVERWLFFAEARHTVMLYYG